ncbi:uncharacterized protein LOC126696564 [Quercus robur]|uniref:uncharacterized protein LOC126696564 n=1 Tax=Quercus robur TaxID=38942 RepID=UPI0021624418|nr:uncharacterized protein LOC126696564 [Quercus robur]
MSLKLFMDKKSNKVLFAEAGKEFIDFLFNFLALPVGTLVPLLNQEVLSSFQNIYQSIPNFGDAYLQPNFIKDTLLKPKVYVPGGCSDSLQLPNVELSTPRKYTCCIESHRYVSNDKIAVCPSCRSYISTYGEIVDTSSIPSSVQRGYVKELVTYMVMDDLEVRPLSSIVSIGTILNKFNIKDIGALEEKVVNLSKDVGLKLLKTSLHSNSVLTDIFLPILEEEVKMEN